MPKFISFLRILFFASVFCGSASIAQSSGAYGTIGFKKPQSQEALEYLGLTGDKKTFTLEEIKTPVLVVEVFSASCHFCQRAAKHFEVLYELVLEKGLSSKIKIIGIGMQSSDPEVEAYKKEFGIQFPLIADQEDQAFRVVGEVAIPYVSVLRRDDNGKLIAVYSKEREMRQSQELLETVLNSAGLSSRGK